jgi:D-glucosaminate-6-phosphate ammonia-lyase
MKVNKEEMLGMMVALETYIKRDHEADWREWEGRVKKIRDSVSAISGVRSEMFVPEIHYRVPHVRIQWDEKATRLTVRDVIKQLREGEPSIEVRPNTSEGLELSVWLLAPGETELVARQVRRVLGA